MGRLLWPWPWPRLIFLLFPPRLLASVGACPSREPGRGHFACSLRMLAHRPNPRAGHGRQPAAVGLPQGAHGDGHAAQRQGAVRAGRAVLYVLCRMGFGHAVQTGRLCRSRADGWCCGVGPGRSPLRLAVQTNPRRRECWPPWQSNAQWRAASARHSCCVRCAAGTTRRCARSTRPSRRGPTTRWPTSAWATPSSQ